MTEIIPSGKNSTPEVMGEDFFDYLRGRVNGDHRESAAEYESVLRSRLELCIEELHGYRFGDITEFALHKELLSQNQETLAAKADAFIASTLLTLVFNELQVGTDGLRGFERTKMANRYIEAMEAPIDSDALKEWIERRRTDVQHQVED